MFGLGAMFVPGPVDPEVPQEFQGLPGTDVDNGNVQGLALPNEMSSVDVSFFVFNEVEISSQNEFFVI